jgi:hypothetical protein
VLLLLGGRLCVVCARRLLLLLVLRHLLQQLTVGAPGIACLVQLSRSLLSARVLLLLQLLSLLPRLLWLLLW